MYHSSRLHSSSSLPSHAWSTCARDASLTLPVSTGQSHPMPPCCFSPKLPNLSCVPFLSFSASWHRLEVAVSLCLAKSYLRLVLKFPLSIRGKPSLILLLSSAVVLGATYLLCCIVHLCGHILRTSCQLQGGGDPRCRDQLRLPLLLSPQN